MLKKYNILLTIFSFLSLGCSSKVATAKEHCNINNPPVQSFVKVIKTIDILSCADENDKDCPTGKKLSSGSGMAVNLNSGAMTVLTAGHVCDAGVTKAIKNYILTIEVIDYQSTIHQAWVILSSQNDQKGSPDACVLWVPTLNVEKIKVSPKDPKVGQELYYVGAPLGIYHPPTVLMFKGIFSGNIDASSALFGAPVLGGASGGAVLNLNNEIVGLIWGANPYFHHASVMTSYKSFINFLRKANKKLNNKVKSQ